MSFLKKMVEVDYGRINLGLATPKGTPLILGAAGVFSFHPCVTSFGRDASSA
jgi:hypothetical protein